MEPQILKLKALVIFLFLARGLEIQAQGVAVVELFTSQGCSSCPAADRNLTEIIERAHTDGKSVFGLSFHVDYWNYIGWKDPYSSKEFTNRQKKYAHELNLNTVYTPQVIVNGELEFVGSARAEVALAIDKVLQKTVPCHVSIPDIRITSEGLKVRYTLDEPFEGEFLNFAVVERKVENDVGQGENRGKHLHHDNVVRLFKTITPSKSGEVHLMIPQIPLGKGTVIVYVQDKHWRVLGAAIQPIPESR